MIPVLYSSSETAFSSNGFGYLTEAVSCTVLEELDGSYELELLYPISGKRYGDIALRTIILAKPNKTDDPQPFRAYSISRPMNGLVTVRARHIVYDLNYIPYIAQVPGEPLGNVLTYLTSNTLVAHNFTLSVHPDSATPAGYYYIYHPASVKNIMSGMDGSITDVFGGSWMYDKFKVYWCSSRGSNNGVTIRYGKNLTDLNQEENLANMYTMLVPYYFKGNYKTGGTWVPGAQQYYRLQTLSYERALILDVTDKFQNSTPTYSDVDAYVQDYIAQHDLTSPDVNITLSYLNLADTVEYKDLALLETVSLGDTVTVIFENLGINTSARIISLKYDTLMDRYITAQVGSVKPDVTTVIANMIRKYNV